MKKESRLGLSIKNMYVVVIGQILTILLNFISRTVIIKVLGINYIGVNGLFTNILSVLSLAELGMGTAIIYSLYKPIADKDEQSIVAYMRFYAKAYRIIGFIVFLIGISLIPFLGLIIQDRPDIDHLYLIYILYVLNSSLTYFFSYKRTLLVADQKQFIISIIEKGFFLLQIIIQIIVLLIIHNFIVYLLIQVIIGLTTNIVISFRVDKTYHFLKTNKTAKLVPEDRRKLFKNISAMFMHNIGSVIVLGTDNILISAFIGIYWVGIYANYIMITGMVKTILGLMFTAATPSIGNLNHTESVEKKHEVFRAIYFLNFWLFGFSTVCLWVLLKPFIVLWIGSEFLLANNIVAIIILNFYIMGMRASVMVFRNTMGLFWNDRYKPLLESIINIVASIILMHYFGLIGILIGTFISTITTSFWIEPYYLYKIGFNNRKLREYFFLYIRYSFVVLITVLVVEKITILVVGGAVISLLLKGIICLVLVNLSFFLFFHRSKEFKVVYNIIKSRIK